VDNNLGTDLRDGGKDDGAVADVFVAVNEIRHLGFKPLEDPGRVTVLTEEEAAQVIVDSEDTVTARREISHGFGADQATAAGN
jgi:cold shock CspA family protein